MSFVHLRCASQASLAYGLMEGETLVDKAKECGHVAVALTDRNTLSEAIDFYSQAKKQGIKPIVGLDAEIETDLTDPTNTLPTRLLLLAKNKKGYARLMELVTRANLHAKHTQPVNLDEDGASEVEGEKPKRKPKGKKATKSNDEVPKIKQSWLKELVQDELIALTGTPELGEIPRLATDTNASPQEVAQRVREALRVYRDIFGDNLYLEVSRNGHEKEDIWVERMVQLSQATKIPLVATHGVLFAEREDFFAHEVHAAITSQQSVTDPDYKAFATREQHYLSTEEMEELFSDIPQAVENAGLVAQRCNATLDFDINHLPNYPLPEGQSLEAEFIRQTQEGLVVRMEELFPDPAERAEQLPIYQARLQEEIDIILGMKFPGYFLVVSDFIRWAKDQDIPVGPGRGSGAGSLVAYSLQITDIDPIKYKLLFERFLNPERVSMPDIDIDFCRDRRDEVIQYIFARYGEEATAQISTRSTLTAKASVLHVGKALNYPLPLCRQVSNLIPKTVGISLDDALKYEDKLQELYDSDKRVRRLLDMARKVEGSPLTTGLHAGGVVIAPGRIDDFAPMMKATGKNVMITQYDKDDVERAGLIKFDLLGLKTLTFVQQAKHLINERPDRKDNPLDMRKVSLEDPSALDLLRSAKTYGVFQLEGQGMRRLVEDLRPDNFEDVVALLALYRPGPMKSGMVENFVHRKHGKAEISYYHPKLEEILKPTYGVIVYQEQVMQIAQIIAGYSLGGADLLRRAMGKKKPEEMAKERVKFEAGAEANGIDKELASELFNAMEKFAEYGFNRSHSAAYAVLSMQTAYLKQEYPTEFFAAYMEIERGNTDVLAQAVEDAKHFGVTIAPIDVNTCIDRFVPRDDKTILYNMGAFKGMSVDTAQDIVECRNAKGEFTGVRDFLHKMNDHLREQSRNMQLKQVVEALVRAGAFDALEPNRALAHAEALQQIEYLGKYNRSAASKTSAKGDIFLPALWNAAGIEAVPAPTVQKSRAQPLVEPEALAQDAVSEWHQVALLDFEKKALGFYLSGHPYRAHIQDIGGDEACFPLSKIAEAEIGPYESVLLMGMVAGIREHNPPSGKKMAFLTLSDGQHLQEIPIFNDTYLSTGHKLKEGAFIGLEANLRPDKRAGREHEISVMAQQVFDKNDLKALLLDSIHVACTKEELPLLQQLHQEFGGKQVGMTVYLPDGDDRYFKAALPSLRFEPSPDLLHKLEHMFPNRVQTEFASSISFAQPDFKNKPARSKPSR